MPYIGKNPVGGGFHKLDALTASATDTYALQLNSVAYYPESANQLLVSLNGVIQAPQDSFTVSGSNLVFDSPLTASDSIDFVVALGDVLAVQTVTDGAITTAKLGNGAVTDAKIDTMAASKLTGALPAIDGSALTGISNPALSMYNMWIRNSNETYSTTNTDLTTDSEWSEWSTKVGSSMSLSSGIFSFPETGIYEITAHAQYVASGATRLYMGFDVQATTDNSTYNRLILPYGTAPSSGYTDIEASVLFDVTDITTHKVYFASVVSGSAILTGYSGYPRSYVTFKKIADT